MKKVLKERGALIKKKSRKVQIDLCRVLNPNIPGLGIKSIAAQHISGLGIRLFAI